MSSKAVEVAALLHNKKVYSVTIETPDNKGSTKETTIEDPEGIAVSAEGDTITFKTNDKTASFVILENAQIITNRTEEADVLVTFAGNGGVQIKSYG
jgi:plastocyanin